MYRAHVETGLPFSRRAPPPSARSSLPPSDRRLAKFPHLAGRCTRGTRVLALFSLSYPCGPACRADQKRTVSQLDEVLTSFSRAHLSFVQQNDRTADREPALTFRIGLLNDSLAVPRRDSASQKSPDRGIRRCLLFSIANKSTRRYILSSILAAIPIYP